MRLPFTLAGLSFGGAVAGDFVAHHSGMVDKVILIDPVYRFQNSTMPLAVMDYVMAVDPAAQAASQLTDFKYPAQFPNWVKKYEEQMRFIGFRHALASTVRNYPGDSIIRNYETMNTFRKKVLLIWGRDDRTVNFSFSDSLRQKLQVEFFPVEDVGHLPHLESPALVNGKIVSFVTN